MRVKIKDLILHFKQTKSAVKTASHFGVHRSTVYRWIKRAKTNYGTFSSRKLSRKSTKPKTIKYSITTEQRKQLSLLREETGYDAAKLKVILKLKVSVSSIHRWLLKKNLINEYGNHRRPRYQETIHMHARNTFKVGYLQMDVKLVTPQLSGLPWTCYECGVIDIYSRYKEGVILNQLDQDGSIIALMEIISKLPFKPLFIQTDNGLEFQEKFRQLVRGLGLKYHYIHKQTPNENAVIERSFRTDEEEFYFRMDRRPSDYDDLRTLFASYLNRYNTQRPHHGLDLKTPIEIIQLSQKS